MGDGKPHGKGFLEESRGNKSSMRLMSVIALFAAVGLSFIVINGEITRLEVYVIFGLLAFASAPKVFHKYAEDKVKPVKLKE